MLLVTTAAIMNESISDLRDRCVGVDRGCCQWSWGSYNYTSYAQSWRGFFGPTSGACFFVFFLPLDIFFLFECQLVRERKKHKAQVELLQLRIPPNAKRKNLLEQNEDVRERLIHCLYSKIPRFPQPPPEGPVSFPSKLNKGFTHRHNMNPRWLHSRVHIRMLYIGANIAESLSNSDSNHFK